MDIIDATLREGLQASRTAVSPRDAEEILELLEAAGIRHVECAHAGASAEWDAILRTVVARRSRAKIMTHARAHEDDIAAAARFGVDQVGIFVGVNRWTRASRTPGKNLDDLLGMIDRSVRAAKSHGLFVRYSVEDASRTEPDDLRRAYAAAVDAGADRLGFPDTLGILEPAQAAGIFADLRRLFPNVQIEVHLHNDRGLAMGVALAALDAGIDFVSTTVNGIGERSGIVDTSMMIANMIHRGTDGGRFDATLLPQLSATVARVYGEPVSPRHPVTGDLAFDHRSDLHRKAWRRDPTTYDWIDPAIVGRASKAVEEPA